VLVFEEHNHADHNVHGVTGNQDQSQSLMAVLSVQLLKKGLPKVNTEIDKAQQDNGNVI
jgi:uncharacterized protein YdcH (DUF465 family)